MPLSRVSTLFPPVTQYPAAWVIRRLSGIAVLVFKSALVYLIMAPKCKNRDAGDSDMPEEATNCLLYVQR